MTAKKSGQLHANFKPKLLLFVCFLKAIRADKESCVGKIPTQGLLYGPCALSALCRLFGECRLFVLLNSASQG